MESFVLVIPLFRNDISIVLQKRLDIFGKICYQVYVPNIDVVYKRVHVCKESCLYSCTEQEYKDLLSDYERESFADVLRVIQNHKL